MGHRERDRCAEERDLCLLHRREQGFLILGQAVQQRALPRATSVHEVVTEALATAQELGAVLDLDCELVLRSLNITPHPAMRVVAVG